MNWKSLILSGLILCGIVSSSLANSGSNYQHFARGIALSTNCILFIDSEGNRSGILFSDGTSLFTYPTNFPSINVTNLYGNFGYFTNLFVTNLNVFTINGTNLNIGTITFNNGTTLSTAPQSSTNIYNQLYVTNIIYTNMDSYVSYNGFPRLSISSITKDAGAGHHPTVYKNMIDTNLTTYIGGTNDANTYCSYYANLGAVYDGYIVAVVSGYDFDAAGVSDVINGSVFYSINPPTFYSAGIVENTASIPWQVIHLKNYTQHYIIKEFHGQYIGVYLRNGDTVHNNGYRIYELMAFGVTNVWRNW